MSWLSNAFGGGHPTNPADVADPFLKQIPGVEKGYYDPFIERGQKASGVSDPIMQQMAQDPEAFINKIMEHYTQSQGYKLQRDEALNAAGNTAAAGGMRGTPQDSYNQADIGSRMQGDDIQKYLQNVFGAQGRGLQGLDQEQQQGFSASSQLASDLANVLGQRGQYAFQGQRELNQRKADQGAAFGGFLGALGGGAMGLMKPKPPVPV